MTNLSVNIDDQTFAALRQVAEVEGCRPDEVAARLLARAARNAKPQTAYDLEAIKAVYAEVEQDEIALAESDREERARLLNNEDAA